MYICSTLTRIVLRYDEKHTTVIFDPVGDREGVKDHTIDADHKAFKYLKCEEVPDNIYLHEKSVKDWIDLLFHHVLWSFNWCFDSILLYLRAYSYIRIDILMTNLIINKRLKQIYYVERFMSFVVWCLSKVFT